VPGSGRTARLVMVIVAVLVIAGMLAAMLLTAPIVGN
jgi:archaellum component FlaG (FlaF/FlaG flagellin family)